MNIFVLIKQVPDTETKIVIDSGKTGIEQSGIKWIMNPYDEFAVQEAIDLKKAEAGSTVTAVRLGSTKETEALRTALAMGCDEAILIETDDIMDSYSTAKALKAAIDKSGKKPDIIFTGKQAIDSDALQVPQILALMLDIPSVTNVMGFEKTSDGVMLKREIEGGVIEVYEVTTSVLAACTKGLNSPKYPTLPGIMKAKRKPITTHKLEELGISSADTKLKYENWRLPEARPAGKKFQPEDDNALPSVSAEVVDLLMNEAKSL